MSWCREGKIDVGHFWKLKGLAVMLSKREILSSSWSTVRFTSTGTRAISVPVHWSLHKEEIVSLRFPH